MKPRTQLESPINRIIAKNEDLSVDPHIKKQIEERIKKAIETNLESIWQKQSTI